MLLYECSKCRCAQVGVTCWRCGHLCSEPNAQHQFFTSTSTTYEYVVAEVEAAPEDPYAYFFTEVLGREEPVLTWPLPGFV